MNDPTQTARGAPMPALSDLLDLKRMLKALGDTVRLQMVTVLARAGEVNVTDLGQMLAAGGHFVSQPLVSWHVSVLRRNGFVRTRRIGRLVYCSLDRVRYDVCLRMLADLVPVPRAEPAPAPSGLSDAPSGLVGRAR